MNVQNTGAAISKPVTRSMSQVRGVHAACPLARRRPCTASTAQGAAQDEAELVISAALSSRPAETQTKPAQWPRATRRLVHFAEAAGARLQTIQAPQSVSAIDDQPGQEVGPDAAIAGLGRDADGAEGERQPVETPAPTSVCTTPG